MNYLVKPEEPAGNKSLDRTETSGDPAPLPWMTGSLVLLLLILALVSPAVAAGLNSPDPAKTDPRIIWSAPIPDDPANHPVVVDDTVYVTYSDTTSDWTHFLPATGQKNGTTPSAKIPTRILPRPRPSQIMLPISGDGMDRYMQ